MTPPSDPAARPPGAMRWLRRIAHAGLTPFRLFRQRISIQMIVSYVAAVLIAIVLLQITIIGAFFWQPAARLFGIEEVMMDPYFGERGRAYAQWLGADRIIEAIEGPNQVVDRKTLDAELRQIVSGSVPGFEPSATTVISAPVAYAAVIDRHGTIIATSNSSWAVAGSTITTLHPEVVRNLAARTLALNGDVDPATGALFSVALNGSRTVTSYPILGRDGTLHGAVILEGDDVIDQLNENRLDIFRNLSFAYLRQLWLFSIPALLVAVPFGVWRARSISSRLDRLAGAAAALAQGNLKTRVLISRRDEIGRLAESFNEMGQQIEETDRARRAFISNVSHDLRTPVSIIHGTAERLLSDQEHARPIDPSSLLVIQHETTMLTRLIDDLFTLARIEEHSLRLEREPLQIASVIHEAVTGMRDLAWTQQKVTIESLLRAELPLVFADRTRLRQIINNLLYNSLRHTPEGGLIIVQAVAVNDVVEVSITDTGRGIPPEVIPNVFNRYYQAERSRRHAGGSGLGLTIVKQLVEAHGGEITIESQLGQGTTFRFTIPQR